MSYGNNMSYRNNTLQNSRVSLKCKMWPPTNLPIYKHTLLNLIITLLWMNWNWLISASMDGTLLWLSYEWTPIDPLVHLWMELHCNAVMDEPNLTHQCTKSTEPQYVVVVDEHELTHHYPNGWNFAMTQLWMNPNFPTNALTDGTSFSFTTSFGC
jgi:hypothetical protein